MPDIYYPSRPIMGVGHINTYPHGHSLQLLRLYSDESCEVSRSRKQRFNKRLFNMSPLFYAVGASGMLLFF